MIARSERDVVGWASDDGPRGTSGSDVAIMNGGAHG